MEFATIREQATIPDGFGSVQPEGTDVMVTNPPRAIVVGAGTIAGIHIDALRRLGVDVVSVVASTPDRSVAAAERFGVRRSDPDLESAIAGSDAQVLHICTPNALHHAMTITGLEAGLHVVCEKPLATSAPEARALTERTDHSDRVHAVCFNNRYYPLVQDLRSRRVDGGLGRIFLVRGSIADDTLWARSDWDWRLDAGLGGPTVVTSTTGSHLIDLVSYVTGSRVVEVCADFGTAHADRRSPSGETSQAALDASARDEVSSVLARFEDGSRGVLSLSHVSAGHPYRVRLELDAELGGAMWDSERPNELWLGHRDEPNRQVVAAPRQVSMPAARWFANPGAYREGFSETFRLLFEQIYGAITGNGELEPDYPTFQDGLAGLCVHDAILASVRTRSWVKVTD